MREASAFMTLNYVWCEKVLAQVVESTWFVWEDLGSSPMYANYVYFVINVLIICWATLCVAEYE